MNAISKFDAGIILRNADAATRLLKAIANQHRLIILSRLAEREYSVGELEQVIGLSQSALSQHLARLRRDKLVSTRRQAQMIFYSLAQSQTKELLESLAAIFGDADNQPQSTLGKNQKSELPIQTQKTV